LDEIIKKRLDFVLLAEYTKCNLIEALKEKKEFLVILRELPAGERQYTEI